MATFEYRKIAWKIQHNPITEINELAEQGWRVVAGGGMENAPYSQTAWVIMERKIQEQGNFNKS